MSEPDRMPPPGQSEINDKIQRDLNPGGAAAVAAGGGGPSHNRGQPKAAPLSKDGRPASTATFLTQCAREHSESLACIERNYQNRAACEPFFQAYKDCRKEETEAQRRARAGGEGTGGGGWFW